MIYRLTLIMMLVAGINGSQAAQKDKAAENSSAPAEKIPAWPEENRRRNAQMKAQVDQWLSQKAEDAAPLHVIYLSCKDQTPFPEHKERLNRVLTEIQTWFRLQMAAAGFGPVTFALERDAQQRVRLHEGKLPFPVTSRSRENIRDTHQACSAAARELLKKSEIDYDRSFVLILTTIPDDHGAAPFFGNIIQDRGYCFAVDTPWLDSNYQQTKGPKVWKGKAVGPANSALVGGIAHELGHGFGLFHCDEAAHQRAFGESLMGSGNYTWRQELRGKKAGTFLLDTDAAFLIARPPFCGKTRELDRRPDARVENISLSQVDKQTLRVSGKVVSDVPVYAVRVFADPPGSKDYNSLCALAVPDSADGHFSLDVKVRPSPGEFQLRLFLHHVNGRWTREHSTMQLSKSGSLDLKLAGRDLLKLSAPAKVSGDHCSVARAQREAERTGWGRLMVGKTPNGPIKIAEQPFADGLFAHAPSRVAYKLGGEWKKLRVTVGVQAGATGAVRFKVLGDGRELTAADMQATAAGKQLELDVSAVDALELIAEPVGKSNRSCWAVWADPILTRND